MINEEPSSLSLGSLALARNPSSKLNLDSIDPSRPCPTRSWLAAVVADWIYSGGLNFSTKTSLRSEQRMMSFSCRVRIGAPDISIEFTASKRRERQSLEGLRK